MTKQEIDNFLHVRHTRVDEIEIANKLYIKIGNSLSNITRQKLSDDPYDDGCIYQLFSYMQQTLLHFIFNNFFAVIGNYDTKKDCLKSWDKFQLSVGNISLLKTIRQRYSVVRNNFSAHISTNFQPSNAPQIPTTQIQTDIDDLRGIFNDIRRENGISVVIQGYDADKHYTVLGVQKLFEQLLSEPQVAE